MKFEYQDREYNFSRYPATTNRSLQPWSAADEHVLKYLAESDLKAKEIAIFNDRFGFLTCVLASSSPSIVLNAKSQEKAIKLNAEQNGIDIDNLNFLNPLEKTLTDFELAIIKIPKSFESYRLILNRIALSIKLDAIVICSFMTRHFSKQMLEIAENYFEVVEQSKAWKKSRLLILKNPKSTEQESQLQEFALNESIILKQHIGVFSSGKIDIATQYLIDNLRLKEKDERILDLGCGNGVLGAFVRFKNPNAEIHLLDDDFLSIESAKMNLAPEKTYFHFNDDLTDFEDNFFDYVVSNPPFHFEHENDIEIPLRLFGEVARCLKPGGRFQLVANRHLNYKTHLVKMFASITTVAENRKFVVYECVKKR